MQLRKVYFPGEFKDDWEFMTLFFACEDEWLEIESASTPSPKKKVKKMKPVVVKLLDGGRDGLPEEDSPVECVGAVPQPSASSGPEIASQDYNIDEDETQGLGDFDCFSTSNID